MTAWVNDAPLPLTPSQPYPRQTRFPTTVPALAPPRARRSTHILPTTESPAVGESSLLRVFHPQINTFANPFCALRYRNHFPRPASSASYFDFSSGYKYRNPGSNSPARRKCSSALSRIERFSAAIPANCSSVPFLSLIHISEPT